MRAFIFSIVIFVSFTVHAQMKVYTVAGNPVATSLSDGGPATAAGIGSDEGIWIDGNCNLYISDLGDRRIRKVNRATGIITTIAGTGVDGYAGDNGPATDANVTSYGLYADASGNVYFADPNSNRIRKISVATGIISTIAGGGITLGDGAAATAAQLSEPANVYGDNNGNLYIGETARIRRINSTGIITTIAGTGVTGLSGDSGPATAAQINHAQGMLSDDRGNFFFADRANHRIRKIDTHGIITTYAGTTDGYSGDGGPATAAQLSGPISFVIDYSGGMVIGDNQNNYLRRVDAQTGTITTIAGMGPSGTGSNLEGALATGAAIHPEFMYLDRQGNIYFSNYGSLVRKVTGYLPGLAGNINDCGETAVPQEPAAQQAISIYPSPAGSELHVHTAALAYGMLTIYNCMGQPVQQQAIAGTETIVATGLLPAGAYYVRVQGADNVMVQRFVKE